MFRKTNINGFTLVELAIVMTIIGLLIGGILKGQQLMENARITSLIKQVNSYTTAVQGFRERYGYMPGDFPLAESRIQNCTPPLCLNGDGNGLLGAEQFVWENFDQSRASENQQFWQQLTMANFASGIETGSNSFGHGRSHPAAPIGGGFSAVFSRGAGVASPSALWLRLHNSLLDANPEVGARITPYQGAIIDRKIDDGLPGTGIVQAFQDGNPSPGDPDNCEHEYDEKSNRAHCMLTFRITN